MDACMGLINAYKITLFVVVFIDKNKINFRKKKKNTNGKHKVLLKQNERTITATITNACNKTTKEIKAKQFSYCFVYKNNKKKI